MEALRSIVGQGRQRVLVGGAVVMTGLLVALQLLFAGRAWLLQGQLALVWGFLLIVLVNVGRQLPRQARTHLAWVLGPGLTLLGVGILLPRWLLFFGGGGVGWMVAAQFVLRGRVRMEYQAAIRHLRRNELDEALAILNRLVKNEPQVAEHYRFRADLYRLSGRARRAIRDYEQVIRLMPDHVAGYTGLAEVYMQLGDHDRALNYALQAVERDPHGWMAAYNLGMIADRLPDAAQAVEALTRALARRIPERRFRLMARFWLARNLVRLGKMTAANEALVAMRRDAGGVDEWDLVLASEQAASVRDLLVEDVQMARALLDGRMTLDALIEAAHDPA